MPPVVEKETSIFLGPKRIAATWVYPEHRKISPIPLVLLLHGWGANSNQTSYIPRARKFAERGAVCLTFDFPGHGESRSWNTAQVSRGDALKAAIAAYECLCKAQDVLHLPDSADRWKVSGFGRSFGAYILAILSGLREFQWLHLGIPASYPDAGFWLPKDSLDKKVVSSYRDQEHGPNEDLALGAIAAFPGTVNIVSSGRDDRIPEQTVQNYLRAAGSRAEHLCIEEALHHGQTPEQENQMMNFAFNSWVADRAIPYA